MAQLFFEEVLPPAGTATARPECVVAAMGHSLGEITAACVSGMLTLPDACTLAAGRGQAMSKVPRGQGAMASCRASHEQVAPVLAAEAPGVVIAAVNGPSGTVFSGAKAAVDQAVAALERRGVRVNPLQVSHGFHSAQIDPALPALRAVAATLRPVQQPLESGGGMATISNVTGSLMANAPDAEYWCAAAASRATEPTAAPCDGCSPAVVCRSPHGGSSAAAAVAAAAVTAAAG